MYEALGQHELAMSAAHRSMSRIETALAQHPDNADIIGVGAFTHAYLGDNKKAEDWATRAALLAPETCTVRYNVACVHAVIGKLDLALEGLNYIYSRAPRARQWLLGVAKHDAQLKSLRGRSEFQDFMSRLENSAIE
jgi:adenylate cyclase